MLKRLLDSGLQVILWLPIDDSAGFHLASTLEIGVHFDSRLLFCLSLLPVLLRTEQTSLIS
jgi:hypothetical protein